MDSVRFIEISTETLIDALFCAGAGMISYGAVLGKASPTQLTILLLLEVGCFSVNDSLLVNGVFGDMGAQDFGGSLSIHAFGAYFGLAASLVLFRSKPLASHPKNGAAYLNDLTAMVGTIFLWIFWPSFNSAVAVVEGGPSLRMYAVINTVISLTGACLGTFSASALLQGKLDMVLLQNATLAGGVAIGSAVTMFADGTVVNVTPGGALATGFVASIVSSLGFVYLSDALESSIGLRDTCGVHNLHGIPGVLGALVAAVALAASGHAGAAGAQLMALGCTLLIGLAGGALSGLVAGLFDRVDDEALVARAFEDGAAFKVEEEEE